jgi:hypothetical protein
MGYCESFNSKLRDELLNAEIFYTLREAQIVIEGWRKHYNTQAALVARLQTTGTGSAYLVNCPTRTSFTGNVDRDFKVGHELTFHPDRLMGADHRRRVNTFQLNTFLLHPSGQKKRACVDRRLGVCNFGDTDAGGRLGALLTSFILSFVEVSIVLFLMPSSGFTTMPLSLHFIMENKPSPVMHVSSVVLLGVRYDR